MKQNTKMIEEKSINHLTYAENLFPHDDVDRQVLERRSKHLQQQKDLVEDDKLDIFLQFRAGNEMFGIPYQYTDEIIQPNRITPVPCVPDFFLGVINRQGILLSIVNINHFLSIEMDKMANPMVIVVKNSTLSLGLRVDEIIGNTMFNMSKLTPAIISETISNDFFLGIYQGQVTLINMENFLSNPSLNVDKKNATIK
jgi:purine-binding chemotaxis protein CheW